jgi:hypothetical protein
VTKKFTKWFKFDESGKPRDWRSADIESLYLKYKDLSLIIVYIFHLCKLVPNWTVYDPENPDLSFMELMTETDMD